MSIEAWGAAVWLYIMPSSYTSFVGTPSCSFLIFFQNEKVGGTSSGS